MSQQLSAVLELEQELNCATKGKIRIEELLGISAKIINLEEYITVVDRRNMRLEAKMEEMREILAEKERKILFLDKLLT